MAPAPHDVVVISSDDEEEVISFGEWVLSHGTLGWIAWIDGSPVLVPRRKPGGVLVGEDDEGEEGRCGEWAVSRGPLGWVAKLGDSPPVPVPVLQKKKNGKDGNDNDDDCVVLDGDPDQSIAVAGAKGRSASSSDEVEIVAVKGEIACKDFPHSRHLCSELPFSTTSHVKHCSMCYCFVCDAPAPRKNWGKGLLNDDHCHATDKETKWKTLRQAFKCESVPATYPEEHPNVAYPTMPSPRQHRYYKEHTPEPEGCFEADQEARVCVRNLPFDIDSVDLAQLFEHAGTVVFSEIIYDMETAQSCGYGFVTMSNVQEAEKAVKIFHHSELDGRPMTVNRAAATSGAHAEERPSPCRSASSSTKLYVSNLPWEVDGPTLKHLFDRYGKVVAAKVVYHGRGTQRRSRGFGFVTMATPEGLQDAIWYLDRQVWKGRKLRVQVAEGSRVRGSLR